MDPIIFAQLNEAYHKGVYVQEETLSEEEYLDIQEWVEALIDEGYDLDQYTDEELYEAYLAEANRGDEHATASMFMSREPDTKKAKKYRRQGRDFRGFLHPSDWETQGEPERQKAHKKGRGVRTRGTGVRQVGTYREELDLYDLVSEYLVSEGFCDSYEDADVIMANMSEEWRENILNEAGRMTGANDQQASWYAQKYGNNSKPRSDSEISKEPGGKEFLARLKKAKEKSKK